MTAHGFDAPAQRLADDSPAQIERMTAHGFDAPVQRMADGSTAQIERMTAHGFDVSAQRLADGFAAQIGRWSRGRGAAAPAVAAATRAAAAVSLSTSAGHTCVHVDNVFAGEDAAQVRALLLDSAVVATPERLEALPLVLDEEGRLYLHRYFDYERRLAARLLAAARRPLQAAAAGTAARLAELFPSRDGPAPDVPAPDGPAPDWQRVAAALALTRRLTVVSGGPGTGKTTTVVNVLACLIEQQPGCRIALAAPTGKAAARMIEAVNARASTLPEAVRRLLPVEARTVHRLLGVTPRGDGFRHHAGNRLPVDVLVVDEASMLDLALATQLLEAVPDDARIILLGDKDQLAAVEAGAVFAEASADPSLDAATRAEVAALCGVEASALQPAAVQPPHALANTTVWFTETHRFAKDSGIGALAAAIRAGDPGAVIALLDAGADGSVRRLDDDRGLVAHVREGYAAYVDAVCTHAGDVSAVARALDGFRVLCAVHEGPRGVQRLNQQCEQMMRSAVARQPSMPAGTPAWYPGRPVMVLRNDYIVKLFNGDVGITLPDEDGVLQVYFAAPDDTFRAVAPARLPEHETAFAITVHKAQGSEFDRVAVVLPEHRSPVVTRELLYTGATRARREVTLCGSPAALERAVLTPTRRHSGLMARLREGARGLAGR
jgi:exodeoxyribonuclease V alpha subunit